MAEFIDFEAKEADEKIITISDDEVKEDEVSDFIDNSVQNDEDPSFYCAIENNEL